MLVASCGTLLVLLGAGALRFDPTGVAMAFGAATVYTAYILVADPATHRVPPVPLSGLVMTGAAAALAVRAVVTGGVDLHFGPAGWLWVVSIAVVSTVAAMLSFFAGLRRTGPSTASILSTFEPVVTTALAAVTIGEFLTPAQLAGGLLVLGSAGIVQLRPRRLTLPADTAGGPALGRGVREHDAARLLGGELPPVAVPPDALEGTAEELPLKRLGREARARPTTQVTPQSAALHESTDL